MPIYKGNKQVTAIYRGDTPIQAIYRGDTLVWSAGVSQCFEDAPFGNLTDRGINRTWNPRPLIDEALRDDPTKNAYLAVFSITIGTGGSTCQLWVADNETGGNPGRAGPDLVTTWESSEEAVTISVGTLSVTVPGPNTSTVRSRDITDVYFWNFPPTSDAWMRIRTFFDAWEDLTATERAEIKITLHAPPARVIDDPPTVPLNLRPVTRTGNSITIAWDAPSGGDPVDFYRVQYRLSTATAWTEEGTTPNLQDTISGLQASTEYDYRVRAENAAGESPWATGETTTRTNEVPPGAVRSLGHTPSADTFALTWLAPNTGGAIRYYEIQWGTDTNYDTGTSFSVTPGYDIRGLTALQAYFYRVRAVNGGGESAWASGFGVTIANPVAAPGPVRNLTGVAASASTINVSWAIPSTGGPVTGYEIQWGTTTAYGSSATPTKTSYVITGLDGGTTYRIRVRATGGGGNGNWRTISVTTEAGLAKPGQVRNLTATVLSQTSIRINWDAPNTGGAPSQYRVQQTGEAAQTTTSRSYTFTGLTAGTAYTFAVRAENNAGNGPSASVSATTAEAPVAAPGVPRNVTAGTPGATSVPLSWDAPNTGGAPSQYRIQWRIGSNDWNEDTTTSRAFTILGLQSSTAYSFRVRAENNGGNSAWVTGSFTTAAPALEEPGDVRSLAATVLNAGSIRIGWLAPNTGGAAESYYVEWGQSDNYDNNASVNGRSYTIEGLLNFTTYNIRVRAVNTAGNGDYSNVSARTAVCALTLPAIPDSAINVGVMLDRVLPAATGGAGSVTYSISGLPAGLTATGRTVRGTSNVSGNHDITYTATDAAGCVATATFRIAITCTIALVSIDDIELDLNESGSFILPAATNPVGSVTYAIRGLPSGLAFNAQTRTISGSASSASSSTITYTATDDAGCVATQTFNLFIRAPAIRLAYPVEIPQAEAGVRFSYTMPAIANPISNQVTYAMGGLAPGLTFDADTRIISGTPTRSKAADDFSPDDYNPTYTVFDTGPPSRSFVQSYQHRITVACTLALPDIEDDRFRDTIAFSKTLPAATNVRGTAQYTLIGDVPSGLTWNAQTRTFTGENTDTRGRFRFTWRVTDGTGCEARESFTINISDRCGISISEPRGLPFDSVFGYYLGLFAGGDTLTGRSEAEPEVLEIDADEQVWALENIRIESGSTDRFGDFISTGVISSSLPVGSTFNTDTGASVVVHRWTGLRVDPIDPNRRYAERVSWTVVVKHKTIPNCEARISFYFIITHN